jgi:hypothetical protein
MENPRKRKRQQITDTMELPEEPPLTQSKATRRQLDIDEQIHFLCQGKHVQLQPPQRKNARKVPPYPIIIRRVHRSIEEQRRVIWLRFGSLESME